MFTLKSIEYTGKLLLGIHDDSDNTTEVYSSDAVYGFMKAGIVIEGITMGNDHITIKDDTVEYKCYADGRVETIEKPVAEPTARVEETVVVETEVEETKVEETVVEEAVTEPTEEITETSEEVGEEVASNTEETSETQEVSVAESLEEACKSKGMDVEVVEVHDEYLCRKVTPEKKPSKVEALKHKSKKAKKREKKHAKKVESKREKAVKVEETEIPSEISSILHNKGVSLEITNKETGVSEVYGFEAEKTTISSTFTREEAYRITRTSCDFTYFFGDEVVIYLPSEVVADFEVKDAMLQVIDKIMKFKGTDESSVLLYDRCCGFNTESIKSFAPFSEELETSGQVIEVRFSIGN